MNETAKTSNRPFWMLLAVTGLPFVAAWILYFNPALVDSLSTSNKGELITPVRAVPDMELQTLDGGVFDTRALKDNWTLLSVAASQCGEGCETNLYHMRQIRLAMGEERSRVLRILVLSDSDPTATAALAERMTPYAGTVVITGPAAARDRLLALLDGDGGDTDDRIFMIDPQGALMMAYPPVPSAKDVLKDLERLLQVVQL